MTGGSCGPRAAAVLLACTLLPFATRAADGAGLFKLHCAPCHQESAAGTVGLAPPLLGEHWAKLGAERSYLPTVLQKGMAGPIKLPGGGSFNGSMPAFGPQLDDEALAAIATHLRGLQGAAGEPAFTAAELAAARAAAGNPGTTRALRLRLLGN